MRFAMYEANAQSASLDQLAASVLRCLLFMIAFCLPECADASCNRRGSSGPGPGAAEDSQADSGCRGVMDASASANSMRATAISWSDCSPIQNSALVPK